MVRGKKERRFPRSHDLMLAAMSSHQASLPCTQSEGKHSKGASSYCGRRGCEMIANMSASVQASWQEGGRRRKPSHSFSHNMQVVISGMMT